jgi:cytochrome c oxidase accessory protein FixG
MFESSLPVFGGCTSGVCSNCSSSQPFASNIGRSTTGRELPGSDALLESPEHVLSTLDRDGSRRWMRPKLSKGTWWHRRRIVAYVLMVVFMVVPHVKIGEKPLIRLDIGARQFTIFFHTFLPTDTLLLALTLLTAFVSIVFITAVTGRAWCGWACPQTVYMEFLFRPIDRLFEGTFGKGGQAKRSLSFPMQLARLAVYLVLVMWLAHTFLAYFVGPERLREWMQSTPFRHPTAFLVMATTTGLLMYDFMIFREQTCLIACPYGRFQSVMLDQQSMIVAYDYNRGEPRKKGKRSAEDKAGHCVDCNQCVVVCPTGIDIRNGLQMECINCTQCIDACDAVMDKVGTPRGLIRYSSQDALAKKPIRMLRARTIIYPILLIVMLSGLGYAISTKYGFDARIIRGKGSPFTTVGRNVISNSFNVRLVNRSESVQHYKLNILTPEDVSLEILDESTIELKPGQTSMVPINIRFEPSLTMGDGNAESTIEIVDDSARRHEIKFNLLGPR